MRGLALKIFLTFWLIQAVLIAAFAVLPDRGTTIRFQNRVRQDGLVASALLEKSGVASCTQFSDAVRDETHVEFALFDARGDAVCASAVTRLAIFRPYLKNPRRDVLASNDAGTFTLVSVRSPSGTFYTAGGALAPGVSMEPIHRPFPYDTVALAILVSGLICFVVARYLTQPIRRMRDASYRLAAGDLQARAGATVRARRDEIGDLVRDFDQMAARIEALVGSQGQLLSDISHELRSPLARLNVALELARRKAGPDAQDDLGRIQSEAERMNELIARLLALSRAESNEASTIADRVDLADLLRRAAADAGYEARRQHKTVSLRIAADAVVVGDIQLVFSAVENVLRNAVRYTAENTAVEVVLDRTGSEATISVRDHGPGVPAAETEQIFSPFHRVEPARSRDAGGVGLGLAIARRAIAVHRGSIGATNAPGGGLAVTIRLPLGSD